jgi:hypothetical protein
MNPLPLMQLATYTHSSNTEVSFGPANQNAYVALIAAPPSASPARHRVAPTIVSPAGTLNVQVAWSKPAMWIVWSPSAASSAPPLAHVFVA